MPDPIQRYAISSHAREEMERRGIHENVVQQVLAAPEQHESVRSGRAMLQSRVAFSGK